MGPNKADFSRMTPKSIFGTYTAPYPPPRIKISKSFRVLGTSCVMIFAPPSPRNGPAFHFYFVFIATQRHRNCFHRRIYLPSKILWNLLLFSTTEIECVCNYSFIFTALKD